MRQAALSRRTAVGDAVVCSRRFTIASAGFHDQGCGVRLDCIVELNAVGTRGKAAERAQIDRRGNAVNVQIDSRNVN